MASPYAQPMRTPATPGAPPGSFQGGAPAEKQPSSAALGSATGEKQSGGMDATEFDFFGGGSAEGSLESPYGMAPPGISPEELAAKKKAWMNNQGLDENGNPLPAYGTSAGNGGTATGFQVGTQQVGASGNVADTWTTQLGADDKPVAGATITERQYTGGPNPSSTADVGTIVPGQGLVGSMGYSPLTASQAGMSVSSDGVLTAGGGDPGGGAVGGYVGSGNPGFDTSGYDRGGMGIGGANYGDTVSRIEGLSDDLMTRSQNPLSRGMGSQEQGDALDRAMGFLNGPRAQNDVMGKALNFQPGAQTGVSSQLDQFLAGPEGPSKAQLLLDDASQRAMSDVLSASRSGRLRDAGSQARAANVAQAEIAGMGVDNARSAGLLRADEADKARTQQLQALAQKGGLAQGIDQTGLGTLSLAGDIGGRLDANTLSALGLGGDLASQMRNAAVTERGQDISRETGLAGLATSLEGNIIDTIPKMEQVRHSDQFDLTPQQQLEEARIGQPQKPSTTDQIIGAISDVLGLL